jgi:hypothetical protein
MARKSRKPNPTSADTLAMSIAVFCQRHDLSQSTYFKLAAAGEGPRTMKIGRRVLISNESAAAWRRQREAAAAA